MKKRLIILPLICCLLLLCGCTAVSRAEKAIDSLATITPDSGTAINAVQTVLDALSEKQLGRVDNLQEFEDKKATYQKICSLLEACETAVGSVGTVTPESGDKLNAAREAYDALEADGLAKYAEPQGKKLEKMEASYARLQELLQKAKAALEGFDSVTLSDQTRLSNARATVNEALKQDLEAYLEAEIAKLEGLESAFADLDAEDRYNKVLNSLRNENYAYGKAEINKLKEVYPDHPKAQSLNQEAGQILLESLQNAINSKAYKKADEMFATFDKTFSDIVTAFPEYETLRGELAAGLEKIRPANGKILQNGIGSGWGKLEITARSDRDAVVRVETFLISENDEPLLFYIRKGETARISIADGLYSLSYSTGDKWYGIEDGFGEDFQSFKTYLAGTVSFKTEYSGNQVSYTVCTGEIPAS